MKVDASAKKDNDLFYALASDITIILSLILKMKWILTSYVSYS